MFPYPWWLIGWLPNDHNQQTTTCAIRRARAAGSGGNQLKDVREARQWPAMGMTALFPALSHLPGPGAGPPQDALCPAAHHRGAHRGRSTARRVLLESGPPFGVTAACASSHAESDQGGCARGGRRLRGGRATSSAWPRSESLPPLNQVQHRSPPARAVPRAR